MSDTDEITKELIPLVELLNLLGFQVRVGYYFDYEYTFNYSINDYVQSNPNHYSIKFNSASTTDVKMTYASETFYTPITDAIILLKENFKYELRKIKINKLL